MSRLAAAAFALFILPGAALGDPLQPGALSEPTRAEESIEIHGLTLPCSGCSVQSNGQFTIIVHGERVATSGDSAVVQLLSAIDPEKGYDGHRPSPAELSRYLAEGLRTPVEADLALRLLFSSKDGREIIKNQAAKFSAQYPVELASLIAAGKGDPDLWRAVWEVPEIIPPEGTERGRSLTNQAGVKAAAAFRHPQLGLEALVDNLTAGDPVRDLEKLDTLIAAVRPFKSEWAEMLSQAQKTIAACAAEIDQQSGRRGFNLFTCTVDNLSSVSSGQKPGAVPQKTAGYEPAVSRYLLRVQAALVMNFITTHTLGPDLRLAAVRQTDFRGHRTPAMHEIVLKAIREAGESNYPAVRSRSSAEENFPMFELFAAADGTIRQALVTLLNRGAVDSWNNDSPEQAISILELSFKIYPEKEASRSDFVQVVTVSTAVRNNPELSARVRSLGLQNVMIEGPDKRKLAIGIGAIAILLMLLIVAVFMRRMPEVQMAREPTLAEIAAERLLLLDYFGLAVGCTEQELTRIFRKKAKELHPDTGAERSHEFSQVVEKYNRLKFLLFGTGTKQTETGWQAADGDASGGPDEP